MSKKHFIDSVRVKDPCTQAWDEMIGTDKVRFCTHCAKDVNDLSAMTRKEAVKLVRKSGGALCIRYVAHPRTARPVFAEELTQLTRRRAPLMAAGVVSASLSLATLAYAQGGAALPSKDNPSPSPATVSECEDSPDKKVIQETRAETLKPEARPHASVPLEGVVQDPMSAVIPGAKVRVLSADGTLLFETETNEEGRFRLDPAPTGEFQLSVTATGFVETNVTGLNAESSVLPDITLEVGGTMGGAMVYIPDFTGALAVAVVSEDINLVRDLISRGEKINFKEENGSTPIFAAVETGNVEILRLLLDAGAKVNIRNNERETPLMSLDEDATPELVDLLLRYGAKVNQVSKNGDTALINAAASARPDVVKALIEAGANLNAQDDTGMTALMKAADENNLENARVLILAGADVNLVANDGESAWDKAEADSELEKFLETHGGKVEKEDGASDTEMPPLVILPPLSY